MDFEEIDTPRSEVPNIDYIGTVEEEGGRAVFKRYPLPDLRSQMVRMERIVLDDSKSVLDLQEIAKDKYAEREDFIESFLAPEPYQNRYVEAVSFPHRMTDEDHHRQLDCQTEYLNAQEDSCHIRFKVYRDHKGAVETIPVPKPVFVAYYLREWNRRLKVSFFNAYRRYAYSRNYLFALREAKLHERLGGSVRMFTTDTIGWTTYTYKINEDVTIRLGSNFAYGRSAYFQLSLFYKEIEIVPFSYYVRYRYANARSLMQYTRSYVPQRESWVEALEYVVACANSAIADSKKFVREYVWNEVEQMMEGLRKCLSAKEFKDEIFPCEYEDAPYLGVRKTASPELGDRPYLARPEDLLVLIKAEKVVGALAMLERLKVLKIIADRVAAAISEIVFGVKQILPEVQNALSRVKDELADFGAKISMLDAKILSARRKVADYDKALEKLMDDAVADMPEDRKNSLPDVNGTKNSVKSRYAVQHPEYVKLKEDLLGMNHERERLIEARDGRSGLAAELEKCYGVGVAGKDFVCVIDKLQPHLETIERMVLFQLGRMKGKGRPVVEVRKAEEARYRKDHPDLEPLFEVRENVLSEIEGLCYSQTNGQKKKGDESHV